MAFTKLMTVNAVGNDEEIRAVTVCKKIVFVEDGAIVGGPTVDWAWKAPDSTDYAGKMAGTPEVFDKPGRAWYAPNELVASVKTATGSSTFIQLEF